MDQTGNVRLKCNVDTRHLVAMQAKPVAISPAAHANDENTTRPLPDEFPDEFCRFEGRDIAEVTSNERRKLFDPGRKPRWAPGLGHGLVLGPESVEDRRAPNSFVGDPVAAQVRR